MIAAVVGLGVPFRVPGPPPIRLSCVVVEHAGIAEVRGDGGLDVLLHGNEPHDHEERHHRGHEVGERHLPRAAVVAGVAALLLLDDDDVLRCRSCPVTACAPCRPYGRDRRRLATARRGTPFRFLRTIGRTSSGSTRRANSTAMAGGMPLCDGQQSGLDALEVLAVESFDPFSSAGDNGLDEAVGQEDAQERADQRRGHAAGRSRPARRRWRPS